MHQLLYGPPVATASRASSDSDNADRIDLGSLPSGMRAFLGHVHTYTKVLH